MLGSRKSSTEFARNKEVLNFFGQPMLKGSYTHIEPDQSNLQTPILFYTHPHGEIWTGDATTWLSSLKSNSIDLIFADPPYNIKKAEWDTFESQQAYVDWSLKWKPHPKGAKPRD